jgi:hypothetical protein
MSDVFRTTDAEKIARIMRLSEAAVRRGGLAKASPFVGTGKFPVLLVTKLTATTKATGYVRYPADVTDPDNLDWASDSVLQNIYPWKLDEDEQVNAGREILCFVWFGRIYFSISEVCIDDLVEEE